MWVKPEDARIKHVPVGICINFCLIYDPISASQAPTSSLPLTCSRFFETILDQTCLGVSGSAVIRILAFSIIFGLRLGLPDIILCNLSYIYIGYIGVCGRALFVTCKLDFGLTIRDHELTLLTFQARG